MKRHRFLLFFIAFITFFSVKGIEIKGTIDLQGNWQPVVYLAALNSPENLFVASPDFIIAETFIAPDGTFFIKTNTQEDSRFYRLYLVKNNNSAVEFNTSTHRNYVHLLLNQNSKIEIKATVSDNTLKIDSIQGSAANKKILLFDEELAVRKKQFTTGLTKAKREYLSQDLQKYIQDFVVEEENTLLGLYALYHLEEKDIDFLKNNEFYFNFQDRIHKQHPGTTYAQEYDELLDELVGFKEMVCKMPEVQPKWKNNLLFFQSLIIFILLVAIVLLWSNFKRSIKKLKANHTKTAEISFANLTEKQQQILQLLSEGKTNKEIAQLLFVELSTVKTHINSIYKQLHLSNRKEASAYYQKRKEEGV